jgi:hypothetical protein
MLTDPKALFALFGQPSVEGLRYIHPLARYVFLAAMIFFFSTSFKTAAGSKAEVPTRG